MFSYHTNLVQSRERYQSLPDADWVTDLRRTVERWYSTKGRDFPWRRSSDSYRILVAEVLLRRTQAERVAGPYLEFIVRFPNTRDLAAADVDWLREWFRPLGLVKRAELLVSAAKAMLAWHGGEVPRDLSEIESLPGLGRYSARAVYCLAYGEPVPMIDESSGRLLRRLIGLSCEGPAYSDRTLYRYAEALVPRETSKAFNLGLLDVAAAFCHVKSPECVQCPLRNLCTQGQLLAGDPSTIGDYA